MLTGPLDPADRRQFVGWLLLLLFLTTLAYAQVGSFGFVYDDGLYITKNAQTLAGLNRHTLAWAFSNLQDGSFLPLIWLSHASCISLFGLQPAGHHLVNLALHLINTALLFRLLHRMTGRLEASAAVAALFALHPLHVESVAWVSGRKDLLSTCFWLLGLGAYVTYTRRPGWRPYLAVFGLFSLGLLSKSMVVTFPLTLLILDFWPLGRLGSQGWRTRGRARLLEKLPFFVASLACGGLTYWAQRGIGAVDAAGPLSLWARVGSAALGLSTYVGQLFWPSGLSPFYPHPGLDLPMARVAIAVSMLAAVSMLCLVQARRRPFLLAGWCWFLVTVLPVSGLIQVGAQAHADRYTYVPLIGLFLMIVWAGEEFLTRSSLSRKVILPLLAIPVAGLLTLTFVQASRWRDAHTLFGHALSLDPRNEIALCNLGQALAAEGKPAEAIAAYVQAIRLRPSFHLAHYNLGDVLEQNGHRDAALAAFMAASRLPSRTVLADYRAAFLLVQKGSFHQAVPLLERVLAASPDRVSSNPADRRVILGATRMSMGLVKKAQGDPVAALAWLRSAVETNPSYADAHACLGTLLSEQGMHDQALDQLRQAAVLDPAEPRYREELGKAMRQAGVGTAARE